MNAPLVYRPTTCTNCRQTFYAPTEWDHGQRVPITTVCGDCTGQGSLFGGGA